MGVEGVEPIRSFLARLFHVEMFGAQWRQGCRATLDAMPEAQARRIREQWGALVLDGGIDAVEYGRLTSHHHATGEDVRGWLADRWRAAFGYALTDARWIHREPPPPDPGPLFAVIVEVGYDEDWRPHAERPGLRAAWSEALAGGEMLAELARWLDDERAASPEALRGWLARKWAATIGPLPGSG